MAAHKNELLVGRVKELWERNLSQNEMLRILTEEDGFDIGKRGLMRLRTQNRWLLRAPNGFTPEPASPAHVSQSSSSSQSNSRSAPLPSAMPQQIPGKNKAVRKLVGQEVAPGTQHNGRIGRRGRARGEAASNPPAPPRFPCETTLDEARAILGLDSDTYREMRSVFGRICDEGDIVKKTVAGPERWEAAKDQLAKEIPQLQAERWANEPNLESRKLAVDVICTDVTKRRRMDTRMTLAEARTMLGINPEESRETRLIFHRLLQEDGVTSKSETTEDQWEDLKTRWIAGSPILGRILALGDGDPDRQQKIKAIDCVALDVLKRLRDDQARRDRSRKRPAGLATPKSTPSPKRKQKSSPVQVLQPQPIPPSPVHRRIEANTVMDNREFNHSQSMSQLTHMELVPTANRPVPVPMGLQTPRPSLQDAPDIMAHGQPRLLSASVLSAQDQNPMPLQSQLGSSLLLGDGPSAFHDQYVQQFTAAAQAHAAAQAFHPVAPAPTSLAMYLRLHPASTFVTATTLWIATLGSPSLQELRHVAASKWPGALCLGVEGMLKDGKGNEVPLQIGHDQELEAYLAHVEGITPTFRVQLVQLVPGWKPG